MVWAFKMRWRERKFGGEGRRFLSVVEMPSRAMHARPLGEFSGESGGLSERMTTAPAEIRYRKAASRRVGRELDYTCCQAHRGADMRGGGPLYMGLRLHMYAAGPVHVFPPEAYVQGVIRSGVGGCGGEGGS